MIWILIVLILIVLGVIAYFLLSGDGSSVASGVSSGSSSGSGALPQPPALPS